MPFYHQLGTIPPKRHTQMRKPNGDLYYEQLFGTVGFDGMSSLLYHHNRPTMVQDMLPSVDVTPEIAIDKNMKSLRLVGFDVPAAADFLESRVALFVNKDLHLGVAAPQQS